MNSMRNIWYLLSDVWYTHKRTLLGISCVVLAVVIAMSLGTFCATDASWWYYQANEQQQLPIANALGVLGAQLAATLLFFFGGAVWVLVPLLLFVAYLLLTRQMLAEHWERIVAGLGATCLYAALFHWHQVDPCNVYPGGLIGHRLIRLSAYYVDAFIITIALYVLLIACLLIALRFSFMPIVTAGIRVMRCVASPVCTVPMMRAVHTFCWVLARPFVWFAGAIHNVCAPDDAIEHDEALSAFEQGVQQGLKDDDFWRSYMEQPTMPTYTSPAYTPSKKPEATPFVPPKPAHKENAQVQKEDKEVQDPFFAHDNQPSPAAYALPDLNIFIGNKQERDDPKMMEHLQEQARMLEEKLSRFGVSGAVVAIKRGPVVTLFEYQPEIDAKISKITALEDDLALALQALSIRIIAPIPGRSVVGFEVANRERRSVLLSQVVRDTVFQESKGALPLVLGHDTVGNNVVVDLARMPHLLIAGSTGSGKSVALNTMLVSLLCKLTPQELKLILVDPKRLEFASYADIAHLLFPIVTHPKKAAPVLKWVVQQMEERYEQMAAVSARNITDYNRIMQQEGKEALPYIVVIIDELADLMMTAGKEIEDLIARIAQMARAAGIHMIVATQRPSVDVITGLIKVNFPSRMSFRVTSKIDSRTILDCAGADKLLGQGDMLFLDSQDSSLQRLHGAYVSDREIQELVHHIQQQQPVSYLDLSEQLADLEEPEEKDALYDEVIAYLQEVDEVSISLLQRKFRIGYNRSARIIDLLEMQGLIGPSGAGKTRSVIRD